MGVNTMLERRRIVMICFTAGIFCVNLLFLAGCEFDSKESSFMKEQSALADIALAGESREARLAAAGRIDDERLLKKVFNETEYHDVRLAVAGRLTDEKYLTKIAVGDDSAAIRRAAVARINDQDALAKVASSDEYWDARRAAFSRVTGEEFLARIAMESKYYEIRLAAVQKVSDEELLAEIAVQDEMASIRRAALRRIGDENLRAKVAEDGGYRRIPRIDFDVRVDGDLTEWERMPYLFLGEEDSVFPEGRRGLWEGVEDLSAKIYTGWDEDNFYIAAAVRDDKHLNLNSGAMLWDGDSLQFALELLCGQELEPFNFGLALASDKVQAYQWRGPDIGLPDAGEYMVVRDDAKGKTFYEMKIPFERLNMEPHAKSSIFGFNVLVFDHDEGPRYNYWLHFSPGIAGGWDVEKFEKFVLWD